MKAALQFFTSLLALGGLLGSAATHATDIAELPLKASVLAKPNVIWGMDDSGSMDWEIQINTTSGVAYWDGTQSWIAGKPLSTSSVDPLQYLFPLGTAAGAGLYSSTSGNGRAAPPIPQFAWTRSPRYNPVYYNSNVTYKPWSPAYLGGALQPAYPNALITAAPAHPAVAGAPTLDLTADWTTGSTGFNTIGGRSFRAIAGMVLPAGSRVENTSTTSAPCDGTGTNALTALQAAMPVPAGRQCRANVPYYPATFWHPTVCATGDTTCVAAPDCTINGTTCVAAPDGSGTKLQRYEIRSSVATYPSGRTYALEMQNFANWFTYYRKRKLMLAGSMSSVLEDITGLRMGVVPFNTPPTPIPMEDADSTDVTKNRLAVAGRFYLNALVSDDTPTLSTLKHIGTQMDSDANLIKYACQKNNAFIVTDGFANDFPQSAPSYTTATYGTGAPYATTTTGSLADLALAYYTNRARASGGSALPAGVVPISESTDASADKNPDLHLNTYAIVLGQQGSVWSPGIDAWATPPTWPAPANNTITMIDDLWHATVNGRGKMYLATSPTETAKGLKDGLDDILKGPGAQSSVAVSTVNLQAGDGFAYLASYSAVGWSGSLTANAINAATAVISDTPTWDAGAILLARDHTTRNIVSHDGSTGVVFNAASVGSLVNPGSAWGADADVMAYLRGNRTLEGTAFRTRKSLMGAVINAEPVVSREENVVYVASSEGMLHAFDTSTGADRGKELWAFVPRAVLPDIGQTSARSYSFRTQLDGTPFIGKSGAGTKLLVAGMGAAGRHYYALDVTTPKTNTEANVTSWVKWQFPAAGDTTNGPKVGQTLGRPSIVRTAAGYRVLVTSGYNSTLDNKGRLFVLNPADGSIAKEFETSEDTASGGSGLAHVTPYAEDDGSVRYVYGGDLLGNLWRFDLDAATLSAPTKVAVLKDASGRLQPVTAQPEVAALGAQRLVLVGTGRLLDVTDWGTTTTSPRQTLYAIADGAAINPARSSLVAQVYSGHSTDVLTTSTVDWATQRGWYMDLPQSASLTEHANTRPVIVYGNIAFVTNTAGTTDCGATSYLYILDIKSGGSTTFESEELFLKSNGTSPTALITSDGEPVITVRDTNGEIENVKPPPPDDVPASKNAWREIRR